MNIPGMEDWDYQIAVHHLGFCAYRVETPLFVYRLDSSTKRMADHAKIDAIVQYINEKWPVYRLEGRPMGCGCGTKKVVRNLPTSTMSSSGAFAQMKSVAAIENDEYVVSEEAVTLEYKGAQESDFRIRSRVRRDLMYKFGANPYSRRRTVLSGDVQFLTSQQREDGSPLFAVVQDNAVEVVSQSVESFLGQTIG